MIMIRSKMDVTPTVDVQASNDICHYFKLLYYIILMLVLAIFLLYVL
jgi:hypothetical protein